jgi:hypothetical protein
VSNRFGLNLVPQNYLQGFEARSPALDIKGKGKIKGTDFDAAFAQVVSSLETTTAKVEPTSGSVDPVEELEKDLNQAKLDDVPVVSPEETIRHVEFKRFVAANASTATLTEYLLQRLGPDAEFRHATWFRGICQMGGRVQSTYECTSRGWRVGFIGRYATYMGRRLYLVG